MAKRHLKLSKEIQSRDFDNDDHYIVHGMLKILFMYGIIYGKNMTRLLFEGEWNKWIRHIRDRISGLSHKAEHARDNLIHFVRFIPDSQGGPMMIDTPRKYHDKTAYERYGLGGHFLDWENRPSIYKEFESSDAILLDPEIPENGDMLQDLPGEISTDEFPQLSMENIGRALRRSYCLTATRRDGSGKFYYRSVPSAGALYPFELYLASISVEGLDDGLYHFDIRRFALTSLSRVSPDSDAVGHSSLTFFMTVIFFRSAWKYRDRSYRYHLLDTGHLAESIATALGAMRIPYEISYDFDDRSVNRFLQLDETREACLAVIRASAHKTNVESAKIHDSFENISSVAPKETRYPAIDEIHRASYRTAAPPGIRPSMYSEIGPEPAELRSIRKPDPWPEMLTYDQAVFIRRSSRNFVSRTLPEPVFNALLWLLSGTGDGDETVAAGFLARGVENLTDGIYMINLSGREIGKVRAGAFTEQMAQVCLDQNWLASASLHFFIAANLEILNTTLGPRGYRHAMLNAGRLGQQIYIAATSLGLGCCGIGAYYDSEAADLIGLNDSSAMLYLLGVGSVRKMVRF